MISIDFKEKFLRYLNYLKCIDYFQVNIVQMRKILIYKLRKKNNFYLLLFCVAQ